MRASSLTPRIGCRIVTSSATSWNASRSEVATSDVPPTARSAATAAARKSSASKPGALPQTIPADAEQAGREVELLEQLRVEDAARLVAGELLVAVGRDGQRVPADEHRARTLRLPEPQQHRRQTR